MENNKVGLGIADVLLIVFIVLKLVGVISWSWLWVLSPFWISVLIYLIIYMVLQFLEILDRRNPFL